MATRKIQIGDIVHVIRGGIYNYGCGVDGYIVEAMGDTFATIRTMLFDGSLAEEAGVIELVHLKKEAKADEKQRLMKFGIQQKEYSLQKYYEQINDTFVGRVISPLKEEAIARAEKEERKYIAALLANLKAVDWKISKIAPDVDWYQFKKMEQAGTMSREQYDRAVAKHAQYMAYCEKVQGQTYEVLNTDGHPDLIVAADERKIEDSVLNERRAAHDHYQKFVCKLVKKIGTHVAATLDGNHVWGYSYLTVTMPDNTTQVWKTHQIVNRSKFNKLFNQWPSKQVSRVNA